jgi:hypothetical protein
VLVFGSGSGKSIKNDKLFTGSGSITRQVAFDEEGEKL